MVLSQTLLDILVCPKCSGSLSMVEGGRALLCEPCQLKFPVRDGVPVMIIEEAEDLKRSRAQTENKGIEWDLPVRTFRIIDGPNKGTSFHLEGGTCKVIGRSLSDPNKTTMFNVDLTLTLDPSTKGLVQKYISKQFKKSTKGKAKEEGELGSFRRTSDIILDDPTISKLHAMIFYDKLGVGILDLVSKNGTFVNGDEIESRLLRKNDVIEMGETRIIFEE